ncbi:putative DNA modification/repair radical SAM protein [Pyrofollis japonicus]|uniref:radical SAM protein n=1 Tax=Pyrofollis japonicus TaxID=3060460 RepID=UPI00295AE543|nr:radical SAM protein [Pyrofollis japonicus]BEP17739.1 putative DNA modification/repair radical SAM protein [Pyrofollis japonicus]
MAWEWKWSKHTILFKGAESFEQTEAPVYHSTGGPLFKTLLSSGCRMDCRYCPFARFCRIARERWDREKLVKAFLTAYEEGIVRGLFLSSALYGDPERVTTDIIEVAEELRRRGYNGYIHLRLMPGTPSQLVKRALEVADRVGINLEAPNPSAFSEIAPSKGSWSLDIYSKLLYAARIAKSAKRVDTQLVLGASDETDTEVLSLIEVLVSNGIGIVHFSPYTPIPGTPLAEKKKKPTPLWRTKQLYEALVLIRDYGFRLKDIKPLIREDGNMPRLGKSLKESIAELHPGWFPVDIATAGQQELLRVPGIGPRSARAIIKLRRSGQKLDVFTLQKILGPQRLRKALPFLDLSNTNR